MRKKRAISYRLGECGEVLRDRTASEGFESVTAEHVSLKDTSMRRVRGDSEGNRLSGSIRCGAQKILEARSDIALLAACVQE